MNVAETITRASLLNGGSPRGWHKQHPETAILPKPNSSNENVHLYTIISTWNEADIIEAAVRNCFASGSSKVFIIDNASDDLTVSKAKAEGACIWKIYETDFYDDDLRIKLENELAAEIVADDTSESVWIASLDADEFYCGSKGVRLVDYLSGINPCFRIVGVNTIELYPKSPDEYVVGRHPADCMTHGIRRFAEHGAFCRDSTHWKHVLLRYSGGIFDIAQNRGNHIPFVPSEFVGLLLEPPEPIVLFHAPYRRKEDSAFRLKKLCDTPDSLDSSRSVVDDLLIGNQGAIKRYRSLEALYAGRFRDVELSHSQVFGREVRGIALYPWRRLLRWSDTTRLPVFL